MIDWIQMRKERRVKLVFVASSDIEDYLLISKLPRTIAVSTFEMPADWIVGGVSYDYQRQGFVFAVFSPEFVPVCLGVTPETIVGDRQLLVHIAEGGE